MSMPPSVSSAIFARRAASASVVRSPIAGKALPPAASISSIVSCARF